MELENEAVLKLIFPNGVPENLQNNPELASYLNKLGTYEIDQLKKEQARLQDESKNIIEQTQELAISNYQTFIQTSECSRSIFTEFESTEDQIGKLIEKMPSFTEKCENFLSHANTFNEHRRLNSITLKKNTQLLELLEIPQLMEKCIREGHYEEALELASYVQKLGQNQGNIPVISGIVTTVESLWHTMLSQLIAQLRTDLQLPKCLQIVGYLRRMQAFDNNELKLKFLQARDTWLVNSLNAIPRDDAQQHLTKAIEVTRINLFNIITQYRAIFPDEDPSQSALSLATSSYDDEGRLFYAWIHQKINNFLIALEADLMQGVNSMDTVLGQCMYFGLSFSRIGADFRALMIPIFIRVIHENFSRAIAEVTQNFERDLEKYTLINKVSSNIHSRKIDQNLLNPPDTLLDFHPLAALCNGYLNVLNELRLCAPIGAAVHITSALQSSLEIVGKRILSFYRQEQQAFTGNERENFITFCTCFAYDLIPYIQRCIHAIFPQSTLTDALGTSLIALEDAGITFLQDKLILEPLKHFLPVKTDVEVSQEKEKTVDVAEAVVPQPIALEG